ncbi:hypothetical protein WJX72_003971 [[Myrmecia] bisecta]|uniref:F-box domain-containing protein n=1 Tax=[Myrmecia] bisecta TaxID=41462 RepID=A0AAW1QQ52_9CHLO
MEGGWADLPDDILFRILVMLSGKDRQAVCKAAHGVCRSWCHQARAATTDVNINLRRLHNAQLRFGDVWQYVAHFPALSSVKVEQPMTALKQRGPVTDALPNGGPGDERSMAMDEAYEGGLTHENSSASFPGPFLRLLRSLPCLHALCLSGMEFEDISALSSLAQLHALSLAFTTASSVEPLTQLTALTYLRLSSTRVMTLKDLLQG